MSFPHELPSPVTAPGRLLALLMAMTAIGPMSLNILVPAVPGLIEKFSTDAETVQLTVSLYLVGLAVSQLVLGPLSDRFGRRPVVIAGLVLTAVASVAAMAVTSITALIVVRLLQAVGASTGFVVGRAIIRDLYERDRAASVMGWVATAMVVAPMIAPLIGGALDTAFGWEAIFVFIAFAVFAVLIWALVALPETRPDHITGGGVAFLARESATLAKSTSFLGYVAAAALGSATFFAFLGAAPHIVVGLMARSSAEYGVWFMLAALGYMAGNFAAARWSPRVGGDNMIWTGLVIEIVGGTIALVAWALFPEGGPAIIFVPQTIIAFGNGVLLPNALAGAVSVRPQAAGTASGITGFVQMGLGAVAAQGLAYAVAHMGSVFPLAFSLLAIAVIAAGSFAMLLPHAGQFIRRQA